MNGAVICLDIGTSYIKLSLFNKYGNLLWMTKTATPYVKGLPDFMTEMEPDKVELAVRELILKAAEQNDVPIVAITVTGMAKSELPVSDDGIPIYNAISWMDNRCADISFNCLDSIFDILQHHPITSTYLPYRLKWMKKNYPHIYEKAACWVNITDYIQSRLVGKNSFQTDYSEACRSLVYDSLNERYNPALVEFFGMDISKLPEVKEAGTVLGKLDESYGLGDGVSVIVGAHDHMSASKAACLHQNSVPLLSTGTSEMLIVPFINDRKIVPNGYNIDHQVDKASWALVGVIARSGDSLSWADKLFGLYKMEERADFIDYYIENYERLPFYVPAAIASNPLNKGSFCGLTNRHTAMDMSLAVIEGLCMESMIVATAMSDITGKTFEMFRLVGGFANIPILLEFKSAALGVPLMAFPGVDMSSLGGYLLCRKALIPDEDNNKAAEEILALQKHYIVKPRQDIEECLLKRLNHYKKLRGIMLDDKGIS